MEKNIWKYGMLDEYMDDDPFILIEFYVPPLRLYKNALLISSCKSKESCMYFISVPIFCIAYKNDMVSSKLNHVLVWRFVLVATSGFMPCSH